MSPKRIAVTFALFVAATILTGCPAAGSEEEYSYYFSAVFPNEADRRRYIEQLITHSANPDNVPLPEPPPIVNIVVVRIEWVEIVPVGGLYPSPIIPKE